MGFLLIILGVGLPAWANAVLVRSFRRRRVGWAFWSVLVASWAIGAAFGVWAGCFFEYRPSPDLRIFGAPIPYAFLHWEGPPGQEQWIDFITPAPLLFAGSNILILSLLAAGPVGLAYGLSRRWQKSA